MQWPVTDSSVVKMGDRIVDLKLHSEMYPFFCLLIR